jgi:threonyl-tRNA synthetase
VAVLPISERFNAYAQQVSDALNRADIRAAVDDRNETIGKKIRENELKRIPYLLIVGEKEEAGNQVSVRKQGEGDKGTMSITDFAQFLNEEINKELAI